MKFILINSKVLKKLLLLFIWVHLLSATQSMAKPLKPRQEKFVQDFVTNFKNWSKPKQKYFNHQLLSTLSQWSIESTYADKKIKEKFSFIQSYPTIFDIIFSNVYASNTQDSYLFCNYGGWMSTLNKKGNCRAPWSSRVRRNKDILNFGPTYSRKYSCGRGRFRCNPTVFGEGSNGKGICIKTNDRDANQATSDCLKYVNQNGSSTDHLKQLISNPSLAAHYIGIAAETIRYCNDYEGDATFCDQLLEILRNSTSIISTCQNATSLYPYLPSIITPLNKAEIDKIANKLGVKFSDYKKELEKKQEKVNIENLAVYQRAIAAYSINSKTKVMMANLKMNLSRCIRDSCIGVKYLHGRERPPRGHRFKPGTKSTKKSVAYCARYVKTAMMGSNAYLNKYPDYVYAVHAGKSLKRAGFTNLMDTPGFSMMTPETAPIGAIIVYKKRGGENGGEAGHIEVRTGENEYISDFVAEKPTRVWGKRIPIGIYFKMPKNLKKELQEIPEL